MQKILVIQTAFIGDVVLATGLLEKLHAKFPAGAIDILVRKGNEPLFHDHPFVNEVLVWDKKGSKYRNLFSLIGKIRRTRYDLVINVQRFAATGLVTALSKAKHTIGFDKNPFSFLFTDAIRHEITEHGKILHETERNHALIASLTDEKAAKPRLYPSKENFDAVAQWKGKPYICIAPASVWFTKQFPAEQWATFIRSLPPSLHVYLLGAPGDASLCSKIGSGSGNASVTNLAGRLGFLESAALQKDAVMNYVNDSAPMHFASAVNANVAAVYCSTIPAFGFGPLSDNSHIIEIEQKLSCRPCGLHGRKECPLGHFHCAGWIRNEQLLQVLDR
ncbi:glycosyltransferase family 9 protein [Sediminibacterium roseum]|uniref:Glycosyltransferase family 9 protein n=1 Tax=Sediminibacterium roseum TaxID=1978412 RepID=A0ABW9ZTZ1_9BACT|nr:glycosyltransferase family 9 protein [Sediminibacterium roseum]NCI50609.1 glycosyltransferase family 9 protein [Sediminibacterium roseum]